MKGVIKMKGYFTKDNLVFLIIFFVVLTLTFVGLNILVGSGIIDIEIIKETFK
jgi:hypothetical protein